MAEQRRSIVAHSSGIAVDVPSCQRLAAAKIAEQAVNPDLDNSTPKVSCWNTGEKLYTGQHKPASGSVEL